MAISTHKLKLSLGKTLQKTANKIFARQNNSELRISKIINIDSQIETFRKTKLSMIKDEKIYYNAKILNSAKIFRDCCERTIFCTQEDKTIRLNLIASNIKNVGLKQMHIGLIVIGIKGMHRKHLGAKVFLTLFDSRFIDPKQVMLGCMEVNMNGGEQIIYFVPDYLIATKDYENNIKLAIKTKGYQMKKGLKTF